MTELKISIPKELADKLKKHPEINWEKIISNTIENYVNNLEINEKKDKSNRISEILDQQKPWKISSIEFQKQLRAEWE